MSGRLTIGLLNNMPDAALLASERQFGGLLAEAAGGDIDVDLRLFSLREIERDERALASMHGRYEGGADALRAAGLDGLIVTGTEPRAADLPDEPYWPALASVIDWTQGAQVPVIWSCLAAHAAVLQQAGVRRRPLAAKRSGVFACHKAGDDPLLAGLPAVFPMPHSRWNELDEGDLTAAGYVVLTRSAVAGVDSFRRPGPAAQLFFQGHPEYQADTLLKEYARDVGRFLTGERADHPVPPYWCFDADAERALAQLAARARRRPDVALLPAYLEIIHQARPSRGWLTPAVALYRAWLEAAVARRMGHRAPDGRWPRDPFLPLGVRRERRLVPRRAVA